LSKTETENILNSEEIKQLSNIKIAGFMGMASNSSNKHQIKEEFNLLHIFFKQHPQLTILSMGMSGDYKIAIQEGSTMIRVGSTIFGRR